jgi:hypothetical protein
MAYINQAEKKVIAAKMKEFMPKEWKYSLAIHNHSQIVCTIKSAPVNLETELKENVNVHIHDGSFSVNEFHFKNHFKDPESNTVKILTQIVDALNTDNYNNSDSMTDYFDVGHYVELRFGKWNQPFVNTSK